MTSPHGPHGRPEVDVLVPTAGRTAELAVVLSGLAAQTGPSFRVVVSDQSDDHPLASSPPVQQLLGLLARQGRDPEVLRHRPRRGLAEHRAFLLARSSAPTVLFLDDDVWLEPGSLARMHEALCTLDCGFAGMAPQGLSFLADVREAEHETFEPWREEVRPERLRRDAPAHERWRLHNAANLAHVAVQQDLGASGWLPYRVAWIGACTLYRRDALLSCGGFDFWADLPPEHAGEDVVAQWRVMERFGGCGVIPSGAVHLESPTTIPVREVDAPDVVALP